MNSAKLSIGVTLVGLFAIPLAALNSVGYAVMGVVILGPIALSIASTGLAIASFIRADRPRWLSVLALIVAIGPGLVVGTLIGLKRYDDYRYQESLAAGYHDPEPSSKSERDSQ
jgi:hypothetical protein